MGPVTIAVDSYGPVTDNAQSRLRALPHRERPEHRGRDQEGLRLRRQLREGQALPRGERRRGQHLQGDGQAGAHRHRRRRRTTMIFSIIMRAHRTASPRAIEKLSLLHAPFLLGLITGGAVIYWFTGASMQAVVTGAYRAVEFIKANIKLEGAEKASASRTARRSSRSARSTRRRGCSTSSSPSSSRRSPSPASTRSSSSATSSRSRSSASTRPSSWPTPAAPGTTRRSSSRSS